MKSVWSRTALILSTTLFVTACSGRVGTTVGQECAEGLRLGNQELEAAKVSGFNGSIQWIKAAGLLADASVHQQLEKYPSCADKVRRARIYLKEAGK